MEYWIVDGHTRSIRRIGIGVDEILTDHLIWHPVSTAEPLTIDVAGFFTTALDRGA
jgi:hypothetical protein